MKTRNVMTTGMTIVFMLLCGTVFCQGKKTETLKIKTSAVCDMCKDRIEKGLEFEKGVKKSDLDVKTKILTITYDPGKTSPDELRKAVSKLGYDADNLPADKAAYAKLPACCKKEETPAKK